MNTKHTPGPWMESSFEVWSPLNGKRFGKVVANLRRAEAPDAETKANAQLISAAPELLEALLECKDLILRHGLKPLPLHSAHFDKGVERAKECGSVLAAIDMVIKKATKE